MLQLETAKADTVGSGLISDNSTALCADILGSIFSQISLT